MAWSKIVGFDVSPVTDSSSMYRLSVPLSSRSRVMLSSQRLWPRLWSNSVAFIVSPPSVRSLGELSQRFESWRRKHVFGAAPAPVPLGAPGHVHPRSAAQIEQILKRSDGERRIGRPGHFHQRRRDLPTIAGRSVQVLPYVLTLPILQVFKPTARRVVVVRTGVDDGIGNVVL